MIEEVLKEITEAEEQAETKRRETFQRGKEIVLQAETEAEKQTKMTAEQCKADMKAALAEAETTAAAKKLVASKKKQIEKAADELLAEFVGKYR